MPSRAPLGLLAAALALLAPASSAQEIKVYGQSLSGLDRFGDAIAVSGGTAVVGARDDDSLVLDGGAAYVFTGAGASWTEQALLLGSGGATGDAFGQSVAVSGDTVIVGAPGADPSGVANAGVAYVFTRSGTTWSQETMLMSPAAEMGLSDRLGTSVAVQGDLAVVGAPNKDEPGAAGVGAAYVYSRAGTVWSEGTKLLPSPLSAWHGFGEAVSLKGGTIVVGAPGFFAAPTDPGAAYVFMGGGASWVLRAQLTASDGQPGDLFGCAVSVDSGRALIGAAEDVHGGLAGAGSAYVFDRSGLTWSEVAKLTASDAAATDGFGSAVSIEGGMALVGAEDDDHSGLLDAGTAYLFAEQGASWSEVRRLRSADADDRDGLGAAVVLQGHTALTGAPYDTLGVENADSVTGLAHDPAGGLFGLESLNGQLLAIEPFPAGHVVGDVGFPNLQGLAYDGLTGVFWGSDITTDQLVRIDPLTGVGTAIGPLGFDQVRGLAFDPVSATLYGSDVTTDELLVVDRASGAATAVGPLGFKAVQGLAFDPTTGTLYGSDVSQDRLIAIDPATGAGTEVGPLGFGKVQALSFDPLALQLVGVDDGDEVITVDPGTGAGTTLAPTYVSKAGSATVFALDLTSNYCTAGTSASGCRASMSASGAASASASSGFTLGATGVEGGRSGLFFFGTNGRQANPWGNGTSLQCVVPPVKRGGLLPKSGTVGLCDGAFAQDLNALWCPATCPKPAKNPGPGSLMQAQLWYRDPWNTSNQTTSLSDAIEFLVGF